MWTTKTVSKVELQTVTMADDLFEGSDIDAEYISYFEDENNNELEDSISEPDYDVTAVSCGQSTGIK